MKKTGQKVFENPSENQLKATTIQSVSEDTSKLVMKQSAQYPNRLICYVKIKIFPSSIDSSIKEPLVKLKGTGCLISDKYLLTAAHNLYKGVEKIEHLKNIKEKYEDESYVRQGLGKGKQLQSFINEFKVESYMINPKYIIKGKTTSPVEDFALLELKVNENYQPEPQYMPIVHLSDKSLSQLKSVQLNGYPLTFNKQQVSNSGDQTSLYMNFLFGASKKLKKVEDHKIIYNIPAEVGSSGGPLVTLFRNKHIIIGIHKGCYKDGGDNEAKSQQKEQESIGVSAGQMLEFLNEKGYKLRRRPFVYTQNTLYLFESVNEFQTKSFLYLANKTLMPYDILVFTAFDLSNITYLTLSYNSLTEIGVEFLLRRNFPKIKSLYLHENKIEKLQDIPEESWKNIETATHLGLSMNFLQTIPIGLRHLKGLKQLWLSTNFMQVVPEHLELICQGNNRENSTIYLYENLSGQQMEKEKAKIEALSQYKTKIVWQNKKEATQAKK